MPGVAGHFLFCGEGGIRTLDTLLAYTHFPGVLFRPLRHLSVICYLLSFSFVLANTSLGKYWMANVTKKTAPKIGAVKTKL